VWNEFPNLRLIGLDTISITSYSQREVGRAAHRAILKSPSELAGRQPIVLVEDMHLADLSPVSQILEMYVCPIRVQGADGAPCTVVATLA
jgi:kynurenine formamidase